MFLAVLLGAGCGGSGGTVERLSAGEFRAQADAICKRANAKILALNHEDVGGGPDVLVRGIDRGLGVVARELTELRGIAPPIAMESMFAEALDQLDKRQGIVRRIRDRYAGGERSAAALATDVALAEQAIAAARGQAESLELTQCFDEDLAQSGDTPVVPLSP
jgi:hypothetical protein